MEKRRFISSFEGTKKAIVVVVLSLFLFQLAAAENAEKSDIVIVLLKNGGELKGVVTEEFDKGIVIDVGYGTVVLSFDDIKEIKAPEGDKKTGALREWSKHVNDTRRRERQRKKDDEAVHARIYESLQEKEAIEEQAKREREYRIKFKDSTKITVEAVLNGEVEAKLLVDTGASKVLIPLEIVEKLPDIGPLPEKKVTTKLADGTEREGTPITLKSIEIDGLKAENVEALTMDMKGQDGLLGMSFLSKFHMRIDSENKEFILQKK
ncbi:MAG: retropepsin-like aspartic protease [Candidatus Omnitrophota bacterium]